jgi:hypothetical protein
MLRAGMAVLPPVRALVVKISAQEGMDPLRAVPHLGIGGARRIIPLVVLARPGQHRQRLVDTRIGWRLWRMLVGIEGQLGRPGEGRAHQRDRAEHIGPHHGAPRRNRGAEIMPHHRGDRAITQGSDQPQRVSDGVEQAKGGEVSIVVGIPPSGAAIAALVGRDNMEPRRGERQHHLAPRIGDLREAVQQQNERPVRSREAGLKHMHPQAIDLCDEAGADAGRKSGRFERFHSQGSR